MAYPAKTDGSLILTAAMELVEEEGVEKLAIRPVAARLGLAPNALYRYYSSLAELQAALITESRSRVLDMMQRAAGRKTPVDAIRAMCDAYLRFSQEHPAIFSLTAKNTGNGQEWDAERLRNCSAFIDQVRRLYGDELAPQAAHALWAFLHGMIVLREAGALDKARFSATFKFGFDTWINAAPKR